MLNNLGGSWRLGLHGWETWKHWLESKSTSKNHILPLMLNWNIQWSGFSMVRLESDDTQGTAGSLDCGPRKENHSYMRYRLLWQWRIPSFALTFPRLTSKKKSALFGSYFTQIMAFEVQKLLSSCINCCATVQILRPFFFLKRAILLREKREF